MYRCCRDNPELLGAACVETGECTQASATQGPPADPRSACPVSETDDCTMAMEFIVLIATQKQEGVTSILRDSNLPLYHPQIYSRSFHRRQHGVKSLDLRVFHVGFDAQLFHLLCDVGKVLIFPSPRCVTCKVSMPVPLSSPGSEVFKWEKDTKHPHQAALHE